MKRRIAISLLLALIPAGVIFAISGCNFYPGSQTDVQRSFSQLATKQAETPTSTEIHRHSATWRARNPEQWQSEAAQDFLNAVNETWAEQMALSQPTDTPEPVVLTHWHMRHACRIAEAQQWPPPLSIPAEGQAVLQSQLQAESQPTREAISYALRTRLPRDTNELAQERVRMGLTRIPELADDHILRIAFGHAMGFLLANQHRASSLATDHFPTPRELCATHWAEPPQQ